MIKKPAIYLNSVKFSLGGRIILSDVNLSINEGEFIAVLGPNGSGKSTLLKLLLGLYKYDQGSIEILGKQPKTGNRDIGYAPQSSSLESDLALRAWDVAGFGFDGDRWGIGFSGAKKTLAVTRVLQEVGLFHLKDTAVGRLSGGEQQRLLIAQALLSDPRILLLDEPLANLDVAYVQTIISLITKVARSRGITVLLVAHDVNPLLPSLDRVIYMANTHSAIGYPQEVITSEQLSALYGSSIEVIRAKGRIFVIGEEK